MMTDRSSEERSRSNEETPKWVQTVAAIRGELMTRFSDRLSMEEIASCAYAVAALEDRQEAAPIQEGLKDLSVRLLRRFAECQPPYDHDNECSFCGVKEGEQHWHTCSWLTARTIFGINPGVPSEATPSKENAPKMIPLDKQFCGRCGCKRGTCVHAKCACWAHTEIYAAPVPEVQGTPTKKSCLYCNEAFSGCSMCRTQVCATCGEPVQNGVTCHEGKVISGIRTVPVGTPQKETPPKQCTWVDRMDFTGGIQCNFQRGHKGRHSFEKAAPVPEGVQGKEPQTPDLPSGYDILHSHLHTEKPWSALIAKIDAAIKSALVSGEAAGRRSAITEMQEWAEKSGVRTREELVAKCAELLGEKP